MAKIVLQNGNLSKIKTEASIQIFDSILFRDPNNTSSSTISLPINRQTGDMIIVIFNHWDDGISERIINNNFTRLVRVTNGSGLYVWYKILDGTETSSITISHSGDALGRRPRISLHHLRNVVGIPEISTSNSLNPPSLTPSWDNQLTAWIAVTSGRTESVEVVSPPEGYGYLTYIGLSGSAQTNSNFQGTAKKISKLKPQDPTVFGLAGTSPSSQFISATIAVRGT
jgi:hypothetical protein